MSNEIAVLRPLSPLGMEAAEAIAPSHDLVGHPDRLGALAELGDRIGYVLTDGHNGFTLEMADRLPNLRHVSCYGVGYDGIDVTGLTARGIPVSNTPDVLNDAVAELAVGMMLGLARDMVRIDNGVRAGEWTKSEIRLTGQLAGSKAGIIGLGRIGKEIAARLVPMKVDVSYHGRTEQTDQPYRYFGDLTAMAAEVHWLICITPGGAGTKHMVDAGVLSALGPEGALLNISRGSVVDEAAMLAALQSGALGGAALDVFENEPKINKAFFDLPNVLLQAHQGSATVKTRTAMAQLALDNIAAHLAGKPLITPVEA
ncbi:MAG: 2-hydroxyacid dehydrogenase [Pseudomonadota bacterium]